MRRSDDGWRARVAEGLPPEIADDVPLDLFGLVTGLPAGTARIPWDGPDVWIIEHPACGRQWRVIGRAAPRTPRAPA